MIELKPCPFCGVALERSEAFSNRSAECFVHPLPDVIDYGMCVMADVKLWSSSPERLDAWNSRADGARIEALEAALRDVRGAIMEHAPDTLWVSLIETAVDSIDAALGSDTEIGA